MKRKLLSLVLAVVMCLSLLPVGALADASGTDGSITWSLDDDGTLTISGTGAMKNSSDTPWRKYYNDIKSVVIGSGVTSIGSSAFRGCSSLTSVTIGDSVQSIVNYAFYNCSSLTGVTIPDGVQSIGYSTFAYCSSLESVTIPKSVQSIGESAFNNCDRLRSATFLGSVPDGLDDSTFLTKVASFTLYVPEGDNTWTDSDYYDIDDNKWAGYHIIIGNGSVEHQHTYTVSVIDPTCTTYGYALHECECGVFYISDYLPATGHSFSLGKCRICGEPDPDYNPGGGDIDTSFFAKLIALIKSLFSWLPFC